jgi:flagellar M-ring protein FliF
MNEQLQGVLKQISITQRLGIVGAALAAVAMIGVLVMFASKPTYTAAFTGVSAADATTIEGALRAAGIAYQVTDAGTTIEVPVDSLGDARNAAGAAGVSTTSGGDTKGWDLFNNQGFGQSQFDQNVTYQRAIEGELTKTIQSMDGVASARVSIVLAQTGALSSEDTPASAAVVISMTGGKRASNGLIQSIVNTVARSVQGLSTDNIVLSDDQGNVLAGAVDSASTAAAQAKDLIEQQTKSKVEMLIATALGDGHSAVAVSAEVDMSKVDQQVTTYAPTGSNPPGSLSVTIEQYGPNAGSNACGIPGTNSNTAGVPSYPGLCANPTAAPTAAAGASASAGASATAAASAAATAAASAAATAAPTAAASDAGTGYQKSSTVINYNVSGTVQHIVTEPGVLKKISVAVFVDEKSMGTLTADTLKTSIAAAIGADATRGDVVAVQAIPFAAQATAAPVAATSPTADIAKTVGSSSGTILGALFAAVMLFLFWMNMRSLGRRSDETVMDLGPATPQSLLAAMPNRAGIPATTAAPDAPAAADVPSATPQARIQERLRMVADERPDALVGLMHGWLREEDRRRS